MTRLPIQAAAIDSQGNRTVVDLAVEVEAVPPPPDGYPPPDILDNLSFETGWEGFTSNIAALEPGPTWWERVTEQAFMGQYSARASWYVGQPGNDAQGRWRHCQRVFSPGALDVYARAYIRFGALLQLAGGACKFFEVGGGPGRQGGCFFNQGGVGMIFDYAGSQGDMVWTPQGAAGGLAPAWEVDRWFCVEFQWQQAPTVRMRLWVDGQPVLRTPGTKPSPALTWEADGWLTTNVTSQASVPLNTIWLFAQISSESQTNSGYCYFDRIAVSRQRIGP